jgi:hypothetical protein
MPDEQSLIAEALRLKAENPSWGYIKIGQTVGLHKDKVRRAVEHAERKAAKLPAIIAPNAGLPALSFYDTARQALAQAKTLAEVNDIADRGSAVREYARRAKDRTLLDDAEEIIVRAERRLGEMVIHIKQTTGLAQGGQPYQDKCTGPELEPVARPPTLDELGIDKKLSSRAQKLASISERAIEAQLAARRASPSRGNERVTTEILRGGPINGARSVMGSRQEPDDSLDFFPTPPWATRALFEHALPRVSEAGTPLSSFRLWRVWEPACGEGHMAQAIEEYVRSCEGSDIHNYNGNAILDFLNAHDLDHIRYDWIITNPPFAEKATERFILRALDLASVGIAMFVRSQWIVEGVGRYERIFRDRPPTLIAFFSERVPLHKGRWEPDGATATAYCWLVWVRDRLPMAPFWIPPGCRQALSRPDDRAKFAAWSLEAEAAE